MGEGWKRLRLGVRNVSLGVAFCEDSIPCWRLFSRILSG